jgi:hypothetical protein
VGAFPISSPHCEGWVLQIHIRAARARREKVFGFAGGANTDLLVEVKRWSFYEECDVMCHEPRAKPFRGVAAQMRLVRPSSVLIGPPSTGSAALRKRRVRRTRGHRNPRPSNGIELNRCPAPSHIRPGFTSDLGTFGRVLLSERVSHMPAETLDTGTPLAAPTFSPAVDDSTTFI